MRLTSIGVAWSTWFVVDHVVLICLWLLGFRFMESVTKVDGFVHLLVLVVLALSAFFSVVHYEPPIHLTPNLLEYSAQR